METIWQIKWTTRWIRRIAIHFMTWSYFLILAGNFIFSGYIWYWQLYSQFQTFTEGAYNNSSFTSKYLGSLLKEQFCPPQKKKDLENVIQTKIVISISKHLNYSKWTSSQMPKKGASRKITSSTHKGGSKTNHAHWNVCIVQGTPDRNRLQPIWQNELREPSISREVTTLAYLWGFSNPSDQHRGQRPVSFLIAWNPQNQYWQSGGQPICQVEHCIQQIFAPASRNATAPGKTSN